MAAIGVAQEFQRIWTAYERQTPTGAVQWWFTKADRRVSVYYFYLWDADFGPAFIKVGGYFPYPAKISLNGHEWGQTPSHPSRDRLHGQSNGFAATDHPASLQENCDRLARAPSTSSASGGWPACPFPDREGWTRWLLVVDLDAAN